MAATLWVAATGPTFTVITTNAFPAGTLRSNLLGAAALASDRRAVNRWFDTSVYANPAPLTFGNSPAPICGARREISGVIAAVDTSCVSMFLRSASIV
ncbi:MAG TPA: hypothetical protein VNY05_26960 [Candidatus Acidoferrales bacterium]|nr:hypothetical protein [Candidatus Acidoferrales bacterium]